MQIRFVSQGSLGEYKPTEEERVDITIFHFAGLGEISYEKELRGESRFFEESAKLSKMQDGTLVCGCVTDTRGHKRKSALVADRGKLLGISDMRNAVDGECSAGAELRIYETKVGKMGVLVAEDLHFVEGIEGLALCGADFVICPYKKAEGELFSVLLRADAYRFGVPILFCGEGYCMIVDSDGEIAFASPNSPAVVEFTPRKEYHLVERRIRRRLS